MDGLTWTCWRYIRSGRPLSLTIHLHQRIDLLSLQSAVTLSHCANHKGIHGPLARALSTLNAMLQVGVGFLTFQEQRSHFALWALMKSPLMLGTDLETLNKDQLDLVSNPEVLAVNQDSLGVPGDLVWKEGPAEVGLFPCKLCY